MHNGKSRPAAPIIYVVSPSDYRPYVKNFIVFAISTCNPVKAYRQVLVYVFRVYVFRVSLFKSDFKVDRNTCYQ